MYTDSVSSLVLFPFILQNFVKCEIGTDDTVNGCSEVNSAIVFHQTPFTIQTNKDLTSEFIWSGDATSKCHLNKNQSLHIELERLSRVSEIAIHEGVIENQLSENLSITASRKESSASVTIDFACSYKYHFQKWAYFNCKHANQDIFINAVKVGVKHESESYNLNLKANDPRNTWMLVIDFGCEDHKNYGAGDTSLECQPKTCRQPDSIRNGQWHYVNHSSYTKVRYFCNYSFEISHEGNGIAHCNSTSNEWEGVPACFTILASALVSNDTAMFFDTLHNSVAEYLMKNFSIVSFCIGIATGLTVSLIVLLMCRKTQNKSQVTKSYNSYCAKCEVLLHQNLPIEDDYLMSGNNSDYEMPISVEQIYDDVSIPTAGQLHASGNVVSIKYNGHAYCAVDDVRLNKNRM